MAQLFVTALARGLKIVEWTAFEADGAVIECTDCGRRFWDQPADFLRYNRWADRWVTKTEEDGTALPDHGVCKPCQDVANASHDESRYGGPNHWQVEQRIIEDEMYVWDR
jgi:hypothetical protein